MKRFTILDKIRGVFDHRYSKKLGKRDTYENCVRGKKGIEIGGPSRIFTDKGNLPLYHVTGSLDGCNYSSSTVWNEEMKSGTGNYRYAEGQTGNQYIQEATKLDQIADGTYDFLLASHCLEHCANPVKALHEWMRVVQADGCLLIVLPHHQGTFDHRRSATGLEHMVEDFELNRGEDDLTAMEEIMRLHDFSLDKSSGTPGEFRERCLKNMDNRCIHHHVFNGQSAARLLNYAGLQIVDAQIKRPYHIVFLAKKAGLGKDNALFLDEAFYKSTSPFGS
jgi:SAM-dependent methyltransferase